MRYFLFGLSSGLFFLGVIYPDQIDRFLITGLYFFIAALFLVDLKT